MLVALPFLREPEPARTARRAGELERRRLELAEERDRALAALKELEFDHRTGKVSDEDYRALVGPLRREAADGAARARAAAGTACEGRTAGVGTGAMEPLEPQVPTPVPSRIRRPARPIRRSRPSSEPGPAVVPEPYPPPDEGDPPSRRSCPSLAHSSFPQVSG